MKFILRPTAYETMEQAAQWYEDHKADLGGIFADRILHTFDLISANPKRFPVHEIIAGRHIRRVIVDDFPYGVFYVVDTDAIVVFAITHLHRDSKEWVKQIPRN